jgi:hypothetical protein
MDAALRPPQRNREEWNMERGYPPYPSWQSFLFADPVVIDVIHHLAVF